MSDSSAPAPRPVGLITILAILAGLAVFLLILDFGFWHRSNPDAFNVAPDQLTKDLAWKATPESRRAYLDDLRAKHNHDLQSYEWVDQKAGVVRIPIDRAMQLVIEQNRKASSSQ